MTTPAYLNRLLHDPLPPDAPPASSVTTTPIPTQPREIHWPIPASHLDPEASQVVRRLNSAGHQAYLVGGCVRDLLFGLQPKDFDVVTSATPRDVKRTFRNSRIIGRRFRLAHVFYRDKIIEVATFRAGAGAESGAATDAPEIESDEASIETPSAAETMIIRDDNVFGTPEQDAVRRDFTVNALFYDVERQLILDHVGGVHDIERRIIRTIGDPAIRLREDPIRMLRAIRLAARLGCRIDEATWSAIELYHDDILQAAAPRVLEDVLRMFRGGAIAPAFDMMLASGVLETILPELFRHLRREVRDGGPEEVEALRRTLLVADAWTHSGRALSDPVQIALLLAPPILGELFAAHGKQVSAQVVTATAALIRPMAQRMAISKRDAERIRQILLTLPKLTPKGRRRRTAAVLARRNFFPDTLDLFEVHAHATGDLIDEAERWRQRMEAKQTLGGDEPEKPRRRRRGGRRRRRGEGDAAEPAV